MLGRAPDGIIAPSGLLTRPARTKPSTCQHVTGERTRMQLIYHYDPIADVVGVVTIEGVRSSTAVHLL